MLLTQKKDYREGLLGCNRNSGTTLSWFEKTAGDSSHQDATLHPWLLPDMAPAPLSQGWQGHSRQVHRALQWHQRLWCVPWGLPRPEPWEVLWPQGWQGVTLPARAGVPVPSRVGIGSQCVWQPQNQQGRHTTPFLGFKIAKMGFLKEAGAGYHWQSKQTHQLPAQEMRAPSKCYQPKDTITPWSSCLSWPEAPQLVQILPQGEIPLLTPWHSSHSAAATGLGKPNAQKDAHTST